MTEKVIQRTDTNEYWQVTGSQWVKNKDDATKFISKYPAKQGAWAILDSHKELDGKLQIV